EREGQQEGGEPPPPVGSLGIEAAADHRQQRQEWTHRWHGGEADAGEEGEALANVKHAPCLHTEKLTSRGQVGSVGKRFLRYPSAPKRRAPHLDCAFGPAFPWRRQMGSGPSRR